MGVDADYLYGYMAEIGDIEWDIDYLKDNFKLDQEIIKALGKEDNIDIDIDLDEIDLDDLEEIGLKCAYVYDSRYLYFTHSELVELFPHRKLNELNQLAKEYAKKCGVKNPEVFRWDEFGYFD